MQRAAPEVHNMSTSTPLDSAEALIFKSCAQHEGFEVVQGVRVNGSC